MNLLNHFKNGSAIIFFILLSNISCAQITEQYFSDALGKENGRIVCHLKLSNSIVIGGATFVNQAYRPCIMVVDQVGNTLWNTSFNDISTYGDPDTYIHKMILGSDNFIYATCMDPSNTNRQVWKVNPSNGSIIWKKPFNLCNPTNLLPDHLVDYDQTKFIVTYFAGPLNNAYDMRLAYISKSNGDTLSTHSLGSNMGRYGLCVDPQKNIYYSKRDSLFKADGTNPSLVIWGQKHISAKIGAFRQIYFDPVTNSAFYIGSKMFGYTNVGKILKINSLNGNLISDYEAATSDVYCQDFKVSGNYLYVAWRHANVGGGAYSYWTTKYNMGTASADWSVVPAIVGIGTPVSQHSGNCQGPLSLDVDVSGNVYLTGYYGDANYGPENWGILLLNGSNGSTIYEKTITNDSINYNNLSFGAAACVFGNNICFVGQLQTTFTSSSQKTKLTLVKLNANTGNIVLKRYLEDVQFPSRTIAITQYTQATTLVMKQFGGKVRLEMYDSLNALSWNKIFSRNYYLGGSNLSVAKNGNIYFSAYSKSKNNYPPYYSVNTDSIHFFQLNGSGLITKVNSFKVNMANAFPVELYSDSLVTIGFYQKNNMLYYRKIFANTLSAEYSTTLSYSTTTFPRQTSVNESSSKLWLFGDNGTNTNFMELDKTTMSLTNVSQLPTPLDKISQVLSIDSIRVALCGNNNLNKESIGIYNTFTKDTIWTRQFTPGNSTAWKCVTDNTGNFLYISSYSANNIVIRKMAVSNGQVFWSYTYNGAVNIENSPLDIIYDHLRNQVVVSGYETTTLNDRSVLVVTIDSAGNEVNSIKRLGEFEGNNYAACSYMSRDGSIWIGGNRNRSVLGLAGFLYRMSSPILTSVKYADSKTPFLLAYPNPFAEQITLTSGKRWQDAKILIYNEMGELVRKEENVSGEFIIVNRNNLPCGIYLLHLIEGGKILSVKKLIVH